MSVHKNQNTGSWDAHVWYRDSQGNRKRKHRRGFRTKKEARVWSEDFKDANSYDHDMTLSQFVELYKKDRWQHLRLSTQVSKEYIINSKILPSFGLKSIGEITARDVMRWQNRLASEEVKPGIPYSATYIRTIHNQLSAILNHACRFYGLAENPAAKAGSIGKKHADAIDFWTREEYASFAQIAMPNTTAYHAFEVLYWTGIRLGELLALTFDDIDFEAKSMCIDKSYQRIRGKDVVTDPKTPKSRRVVALPDFLCLELRQYAAVQFDFSPVSRMFPISKSYLSYRLKQYAEQAGVKPIRIHDLRHSHVSHLINLGFSAVAIADRLGHENIEVTYRYAHLFPHRQTEIANRLNEEMEVESYG